MNIVITMLKFKRIWNVFYFPYYLMHLMSGLAVVSSWKQFEGVVQITTF